MKKITLVAVVSVLASMAGSAAAASLLMAAGPAFTSTQTATKKDNFNYLGAHDTTTPGFKALAAKNDEQGNSWVIGNVANGKTTKDGFHSHLFFNSNFGPDNDGSAGKSIFTSASITASEVNSSLTVLGRWAIVVTIEDAKVNLQIFWASENGMIESTNSTEITQLTPAKIGNDANNIAFSQVDGASNKLMFSALDTTNNTVGIYYIKLIPFIGTIEYVPLATTSEITDANSTKVTSLTEIHPGIDGGIYLLSTDKKTWSVKISELVTANPQFITLGSPYDARIVSNINYTDSGYPLFVVEKTNVVVEPDADTSYELVEIKSIPSGEFENKLTTARPITINHNKLVYLDSNDFGVDKYGDIYFTASFTNRHQSDAILEWVNTASNPADADHASKVIHGLPSDLEDPIYKIYNLDWKGHGFSVLVDYGQTPNYPEDYTNMYQISTPENTSNTNYGLIVAGVVGFIAAIAFAGTATYGTTKFVKKMKAKKATGTIDKTNLDKKVTVEEKDNLEVKEDKSVAANKVKKAAVKKTPKKAKK